MLVTTSAGTLWVNLFSDFRLFFVWIIIRALETKESFVTQTRSTVADPGEGLGGLPPPPLLFLVENEARRAERIFFEVGCPLIWRSGSATGWIHLAGSHETWEMSIYPNALYLYCGMQFSNFFKGSVSEWLKMIEFWLLWAEAGFRPVVF